MEEWIYRTNPDNSARFLLGHRETSLSTANPGMGRLLVAVGINPSTASPEKLDNTVITVRNRAVALGYDSWCTINVYPQRATDPNGMDKTRNEKLHQMNLGEIGRFFQSLDTPPDIWGAWGSLIRKRSYLPSCLGDIAKTVAPLAKRWYTIGARTKEGHPHHPLYLKKGLPPEDFDIVRYLEDLHE